MSSTLLPLKPSAINLSIPLQETDTLSTEPQFMPEDDITKRSNLKSKYKPYENKSTHKTPEPFSFPPNIVPIKKVNKTKNKRKSFLTKLKKALELTIVLNNEAFKQEDFIVIFAALQLELTS